MPKKKARVRIERVISSAERHAYEPAYVLEPTGPIAQPASLPVGTVLEVVSIPKEKK